MSTNGTSEALAELMAIKAIADTDPQHRVIDLFQRTRLYLPAIAQKYKRMEEALLGIRSVNGSFLNQRLQNKLMNLDHIAKEALEFDPLSSIA